MSSHQRGRPLFKVNCLYFTYGSNLDVALMAERCPHSVFVGPATLPGHRLIMDQSGGASIVGSALDQVEGLVYTITPEDEETLHQLSQVVAPNEVYASRFQTVICRDYGKYSGLKSSSLAQLLENLPPVVGPLLQHGGDRPEKALVYVKEDFQRQGPAWGVLRVASRAMIDAVLLGVPQPFFDAAVIPYLPRPGSTMAGPAASHDSAPNKTISSKAMGKMVANEPGAPTTHGITSTGSFNSMTNNVSSSSNAHAMFTGPPRAPSTGGMTSGRPIYSGSLSAPVSEPGGNLAPQGVPGKPNNPSPPRPETTLSMAGVRQRIRDYCAALDVPFVLASLEDGSCVPMVPERTLKPVYVVQVIRDLAWSKPDCKVATVTYDVVLANEVALIMLQGVLEEAMNVNPDVLTRVLTDDWFRMMMGGEVDEGAMEQRIEEGCLRLVANLGQGKGRVGVVVVKHQIAVRAVVDSKDE